jgi:hypothetical protein
MQRLGEVLNRPLGSPMVLGSIEGIYEANLHAVK